MVGIRSLKMEGRRGHLPPRGGGGRIQEDVYMIHLPVSLCSRKANIGLKFTQVPFMVKCACAVKSLKLSQVPLASVSLEAIMIIARLPRRLSRHSTIIVLVYADDL
ncbi:hypothetical protein HAX54_016388 [Datura stramonium]|uniref:Uncharacterized protein n=1 Tax=Datura stramonium TaxID=4076 RepID=A0ABS8RZY7_DATST|nr:hypothetical protein [Datura stramonium]